MAQAGSVTHHSEFGRARKHARSLLERRRRAIRDALEYAERNKPPTPLYFPRERWSEETTYIVGGGKSAAAVDLEALRGRGIVMAVNDSAIHLPWCDVAFSANGNWIRRRLQFLQLRRAVSILAVRPLREVGVPRAQIVLLEAGHLPGDSPYVVRMGHSSGSAALNCAITQGSRRIVLIGFDMDSESPGHWHGGYPWVSKWGPEHYETWASAFQAVADLLPSLGIQVLNANPMSRVRCFPFVDPASLPL